MMRMSETIEECQCEIFGASYLHLMIIQIKRQTINAFFNEDQISVRKLVPICSPRPVYSDTFLYSHHRASLYRKFFSHLHMEGVSVVLRTRV